MDKIELKRQERFNTIMSIAPDLIWFKVKRWKVEYGPRPVTQQSKNRRYIEMDERHTKIGDKFGQK